MPNILRALLFAAAMLGIAGISRLGYIDPGAASALIAGLSALTVVIVTRNSRCREAC